MEIDKKVELLKYIDVYYINLDEEEATDIQNHKNLEQITEKALQTINKDFKIKGKMVISRPRYIDKTNKGYLLVVQTELEKLECEVYGIYNHRYRFTAEYMSYETIYLGGTVTLQEDIMLTKEREREEKSEGKDGN